MKHYVYILYSEQLGKYYIGSTSNINIRINLHLHSAKTKYTHQADDWILHYNIECASKPQAVAIEKHIKSMKSKAYINNLLKYPEMSNKLLLKYNQVTD
jgi:putative endonuclease